MRSLGYEVVENGNGWSAFLQNKTVPAVGRLDLRNQAGSAISQLQKKVDFRFPGEVGLNPCQQIDELLSSRHPELNRWLTLLTTASAQSGPP